MIWKTPVDLQRLNGQYLPLAARNIDMVLTKFDDVSLTAKIPVDERTVQPYGILHGGISCLLAETLGSIAGSLCVTPGTKVVGISLNASHVGQATGGFVEATARAKHLGRSTQVWQIEITRDDGRLVCAVMFTLAVLEGVPGPSGR